MWSNVARCMCSKKRRMSIVDMDGELTAAPADMVAAPTVWEEFKVVVKNPVYLCVVLGYAAYTFVTAGFANFGPIFLLGLVSCRHCMLVGERDCSQYVTRRASSPRRLLRR